MLDPEIFAIDVGNTRAKFGVFRAGDDGLPEALQIFACVLEQTPRLAEAVRNWVCQLQTTLPATAMIAGSDPELRDALVQQWALPDCEPIVVQHYSQIPVDVDVDEPARVGIDRLLNTMAALRMTRGHAPVIAVDSGTATTVDLMTADGIFRGGSILPGLRLSAHAMHDYTARLPLLNTDEDRAELPLLPGRNTEDAMRAGLYIGQLGAVRELCHGLTQASTRLFAQQAAPALFVSGGGGRQLVRHLPGARYVDSLALHGLAMLAVK